MLRRSKNHSIALVVLLLLWLGVITTHSYAQSRFSVVLNEQSNNGDSPKSVTFYDADALADGPLFSVFTGYESANNFDEPNSIAVDPDTGDVYILAFDSGTPGNIDGATLGSSGEDTEGDYDLLRINFNTVFTDWQTNYQGINVRSPNIVGGPAPTPDDGSGNAYANSSNLDYVTYGVTSPDFTPFDFAISHSNQVVLPGAIEKIGEVKRNAGGGDFFNTSLEFVDQNTLLLIDDSSEPSATDTAANDHSIRILERVATTPGAANGAVGDHLNGGFNRGTTESWNSRSIGPINLDFDGSGTPLGHSEVESSAFYHDASTGVRGLWITESDSGGDDVAFAEIDGSGNFVGYRPHAVGGGPDFPTSFALDNDPAANSTSNDGKADNIFVDQDTGDLIIIEGGFGDTADGVAGGDHEPAVIRREVISYDDGTGKIQFGAWSNKVILDPNTNATPGESPAFLERGQFAAYDSENDLVYFWNPGNGGSEAPAFGLDVWVLDISTGVTTAFLDLDDSTSLFQSSSFGDKTDFFTLPADGDFDNDGDVDGADFLAWQRGFPDTFDADDLSDWQSAYSGGELTGQVAAVPEPASLLMVGLVLLSLSARRKPRV